MTEKISTALVGAGAMGGALLRAWLDKGVIDGAASAVFDPAPSAFVPEMARERGLAINPPTSARVFDALVIAVKPQAAGDILTAFGAIAERALILSVMAGKSIASVRSALPGAQRVVRAMPNLPAAIGAGASALYAPAEIGAKDRLASERLMRAVGDVVWVESEDAIDAVTAISGSGPAYFFIFAEALAEAAREIGLSDAVAERLARATLAGAGAYAASETRSLAELRRKVTSPGGTTEAALKILDGDDQALRRLIKAAAAAARRRAAELSD